MGKDEVLCHNVGFYQPECRAIHCMALQRKRKKLALSRSDNSLEIWDVRFKPYLQKFFTVLPISIEDLKWCGTRLFSCGLQGYLVEYDCLNESVLYSVSVTGGPAWCLDINKKRKLIACGTEEGYINIFEIKDETVEFSKFLDKQQGRILCLCWDKSGQHLITGSVDVIRIWDVDTGHALHKMQTGRNQNNKETVVWCISVTSDLTIISGDSRGCLCFWDGKLGVHLETNNSHDADILSLALSKDETKVYCAGVDPLIAVYGRVAEYSGGRRKWAKGGQRKIHEHDVRALALSSDERLFSGGIDGYLALSSYPPKVLIKFPPLLKSPCTSLATMKKYVLLRYLSHLELWKLGQIGQCQDSYDSFVPLNENEVQLLQLKAKKNDFIISSSISEDGRFIAYSTDSAIHFFKFLPDETISLIKLPQPKKCSPARLIKFYRMKTKQFCASVTKNNEINIFEIMDDGPEIIATIKPLEKELFSNTITHLTVTSETSYLIAADSDSNIGVWSILNWDFLFSLPKYRAAVTAISMRSGSNLAVIAYSDLKIIEYDLKENECTSFSKKMPENMSSCLHTPVSSIAFDSRRKSSLIVHDDSNICVFDKSEKSHKSSAKLPKLDESENRSPRKDQKFNVIKRSKHIVSVDWLEGEEMVIVSVNPLKLAENLPPTLARKLFGT